MVSQRHSSELPPRARRIHFTSGFDRHFRGTTSACAENTGYPQRLVQHHGNYLRVRGEYLYKKLVRQHAVELPPRARRIRPDRNQQIERNGTTSACAENTWTPHRQWPNMWNYLRVRGEYHIEPYQVIVELELPPRARRILFHP